MPDTPYRVLIVEDDKTIAMLVGENLQQHGFAVSIVERFDDILPQYRQVQPHLTLMDISLPYFNGFYWCGEIRKESTAPILFLTSHTDNADVVMAVNTGGDDYITKPFSMEVLAAKVQALLRRAYGYAVEAPVLGAQEATLNTADGTLSYGEHTLDLTRNESRILRTLLENKNKIVSRSHLMRVLWDDEHFIDENTLTVNINRLRRKLEGIGLSALIETKKGEGYIIRD